MSLSSPARVKTTVLIVGAGPAGLATAIGLARQGIDFVIVDALPAAQNTSRAAVIHAATLETMVYLGVADTLIDLGIKVRTFRARDRDTVLLASDFSSLPTSMPYALMIPQDETEAILIARLAQLGHEIRRPVRMTSLKRTGHGVEVLCEGPEGAIAFEARYVVGADGEYSAVRASAGIGFPGLTYGSFLLADIRMDWPLSRDEVTLFFSETGTMVIAPMSRDRFRLVAQLPDAPSEPGLADVQRVLDAGGPRAGAHVREVLWGSRFQVHHRLADRFRDGLVLLVGDAAHVHSPAGGQGMNLGLRDAWALSEALAECIRANTDAPLDAYAAERRLAAEKVLAMTHRLTRIATLSSPPARWLRNRLISAAASLPAVRRYAARTLAGY